MVERYRRYLQSLPLELRKEPTIVRLTKRGPVEISPEDQLKEMEQGTELGQELQAAEEKLLKWQEDRKNRIISQG